MDDFCFGKMVFDIDFSRTCYTGDTCYLIGERCFRGGEILARIGDFYFCLGVSWALTTLILMFAGSDELKSSMAPDWADRSLSTLVDYLLRLLLGSMLSHSSSRSLIISPIVLLLALSMI